MSNVFVVPDMHGMHRNLAKLLEEAGVINSAGYRIDKDVDVISLGDLANCVGDPRRDGLEDDIKCLARVGDWIDLLLVGNHEHPYWGGTPFSGFRHKIQIASILFNLEQEKFIAPATNVDGILISHAGLTPHWANAIGVKEPDEAAAALEFLWSEDATHAVFDSIGYVRGGRASSGGILWADYSETKSQKFRQLIGHSIGDKVRQFGTHGSKAEGSYCIDLGSGRHGDRIAGAFIRDGEIEIMEVDLG